MSGGWIDEFLRRGGVECSKLFTMDLICHGVPSEYVWNRYLDYREQKEHATVKKASFRQKTSGWKLFSLSLGFSNDKEYTEILSKDPYMQAFLNNANLRPCCYECNFKTIDRISDFTMADCWGVENIKPEWNDDKGVSLLLIHSKRGNKLFGLVKDNSRYIKISISDVIRYNRMIVASMKPHPKRKQFISQIDQLPFDILVKKYGQVPFREKSIIYRAFRKLMRMMKF